MKRSSRFFYQTLKLIFKPFGMLIFRPKAVNKKIIPKEGPIIFCGNHFSLYDQFMLIINYKKAISFLTKSEYFDDKRVAWFFKNVGCIRTDRNNKGGDALLVAEELLKKGAPVGIFPEGTRNKTTDPLLPFKFGAVSLAKKTGAWIVPFGITGKYRVRDNKLKIEFGTPFKVGEMSLEEANEKLYNEVLSIITKE